MEYAACNVVYVDRTAQEERLVKRHDTPTTNPAISVQDHDEGNATVPNLVDGDLKTLLGTFSEVHVCTTGKSCMSKLSELNQSSIVELIPTLVLIDIPYEDQSGSKRPSREVRTPSPNSRDQSEPRYEAHVDADDEEYGLGLLQWIASEIQYQSLSKLIVPVALVTVPDHEEERGRTGSRDSRSGEHLSLDPFASVPKKRKPTATLDQGRTMKYLDAGAVDVLTSPLLPDRLPSLAIHAYRAHKDASKEHRALLELKRGRKRSWVGVDDQKPYAYLREAMVSGLMDGICKLGGEDEPFSYNRITVALDRREKIASAIGTWSFSAHDFTDDELLHAALLMLQHALTMPELERWRISTENLTAFLVASRSAYNAFVPYHNFRHVVDVLQAIFYFLVALGRLPPFPDYNAHDQEEPSPIAALIRPFDALTLLITAIGHDVGHPGVNNAFLVTLNAPLAQLYNDRSVLESFHCAAYSQILRRHWPIAFQGTEMRQLMINSILATDMGLHFDYMKKMGWMQEKLHENGGTDGWDGRLIDDQRTLACSLLIKCADISNVARRYDVAAQWTRILTDEFARQATMESDLGIPSALFAAPVREIVELGKSQIGFMNMFAIPLFQGVTDVMPAMTFCMEELHNNQAMWSRKISEEQARIRKDSEDSVMTDGVFSPRSMSVAQPSDSSLHRRSIGNATLLPSDADFRKGLSKNLFAPTNGVLSESPDSEEAPHYLIPNFSRPGSMSNRDSGAGSQDTIEPPPSQVQLSYVTASTSGFVDYSSHGPDVLRNGTHVNGVTPSLITDPVVIDPPTPEEAKHISLQEHEKQRSMDGTEAGSSAAGDWASQATSATTSKMPLSPSTQGTSITSQDSVEKASLSQTPTGSPVRYRRNESSVSDLDGVAPETPEGKSGLVMEKVKSLKKKPSRFRMDKLNFWRRSKSASPPVPVPDPPRNHRRTGSQEENAPRASDHC
ncbi:hypothetical protein HYALB_00001680 [Hymenoscyphus albidus]|uniref:Phosphodiesterase n=1 Tax=Hymenoscyphus albidus TaxID=595503 RepID=A0A9N9LGI4_9HELO|nr:hypothetical protein HYALB_00001680 [Hymenoscyphus albidus]